METRKVCTSCMQSSLPSHDDQFGVGKYVRDRKIVFRALVEPVISIAIADADVIATKAVDARRILRILNLPKDYVAGIGNTPKILKNT